MSERQEGEYYGHKTLADGTHVALSADEARALYPGAALELVPEDRPHD